MNHEEAGLFWNENAEAWTLLARAGYDVYRDYVNTPAFFATLPKIAGLSGLDIGCGEGHNTRLLADRGARVTAIDISETFIRYAMQMEAAAPSGIDYRTASAVALPFEEAVFDFAVAFMSLMDVPEIDRVLAEAYRVLKPGGFLQFSIEHPCFTTRHRRTRRNHEGLVYAVEVGDYFHHTNGGIHEWLFGAAPPDLKTSLRPFRTPRFYRTLSQWMNALVATGFTIEHVDEPRASDDAVLACPRIQGAQVVAYFLHLRVRKPQ